MNFDPYSLIDRVAKATAHDPYRGAYARMNARRSISDSTTHRLLPTATVLGEFHFLTSIVSARRPHWVYTSLHPAVEAALTDFGKPHDWHLLVLEQPQVASDGIRVAYVRNEDKRIAHWKERENNKHLMATTAGKYLTRHWPSVPADRIRNLVARFTAGFEMWDTKAGILKAINDCSAESCMTYSEDDMNRLGDHHPYEVYDPKFGWKIAVKKDDTGRLTGRALVIDTPKHKGFVRTYTGTNSSGYTQSCAAMQGWLESQGYKYWDEWPEGVKFAKIEIRRGAHLAPYLDPGGDRIASSMSRNVRDCGDYLVRDNDGDYTWDNTDGTPDEAEERETCECCGNRYHASDMRWVGRHGDTYVCDGCVDDDYIHVRGENRSWYYVHNDRAIETTSGDWYDSEYLEENHIVELHDGGYVHLDDTVYVESENTYYLCDDVAANPDDFGAVVCIDGDYVLIEEAEWCIHLEQWIMEDDAVSVGDGKYVHKTDLDDYLCDLTREEIDAYCATASSDLAEEKLAMWLDWNEVSLPSPVALPPPVPATTMLAA